MLLLAWAIFMRLAHMVAASDEQFISSWQSPRVNVIRDTVYLQGGYMAKASSLTPNISHSYHELDSKYFTFNLSQTFNSTSNVSKLLEIQDVSSANLLDFISGAMFADDYEFILYGGSKQETNQEKLPDAQSIVVHLQYPRGEAQTSSVPGTKELMLQDGINRYVLGGAGTSAPSESLGFYFSGRHNANWNDTDYSNELNETSQKLIIADLAQKDDTDGWKNETIPDNIPGRPGAELVWVPVSDQGMLVVIGGSSDSLEMYAQQPFATLKNQPDVASQYMKTISIYDVKSHKWYQQNATGDVPPITASFCAVLATDQENSVHNIYIYGGYNGTDDVAHGRDDVYVLTLPRFEWVKLYDGQQNEYGRFAHRCVVPDPSRMISIGGVPNWQLDPLNQTFRTFDLNEGKFVDGYDPKSWKNYSMPEAVAKASGLSNKKRATADIKPAKGWSSTELEKHWNTKYPKTIQHYYPYTSDSTNKPGEPESEKKHKHLPKWVPPFLGVVCGLIGIAIIVAAFLLIRRRRRQAREKARVQALQEAAEIQKASLKYNMVDENGVPIYEGYPHGNQHYEPPPAEIDSMPVHELADTAIPAELPANNPKIAPSPVYKKDSKAFSKSRSFDDMVGQKGLSVKKNDAETKSVDHARRPYGDDDTQDQRRSI